MDTDVYLLTLRFVNIVKKNQQDLYLLTLINVEMDANNRRLPTYSCTRGFADMNKDPLTVGSVDIDQHAGHWIYYRKCGNEYRQFIFIY